MTSHDELEPWREGLHDLPDALHTTPAVARVLSGSARAQRMLDFESALARAEARAGLIPESVAEAITEAATDADLDIAALSRQGAVAGTFAVPVVNALRALVPDDVKGYVHLGATSQDVIDTAMVLQARDALELVVDDLVGAGRACADLCRAHADTVMVGRTLLQQAIPITFGLKAAGWLSGCTRQIHRLDELRREVLVLQFGGAAGTLASLGNDGLRVTALLAEELGLEAPSLPWHTERTRVAELAGALATTCGAMAKVARDVVLMSQTEVAEAAEAGGEGKGRSSAMPQKRNPVDTMAVLASARHAVGHAATVFGGMAQEHERAIGDWQAEATALPALLALTASSVARIRWTLEGLEVDAEQMRRNLDRTGGQPMAESLATALTRHLGKHEAYRRISAAATRALEEQRSLTETAAEDPEIGGLLSREALEAALDPTGYLGSADAYVRAALADFEAIADDRSPGSA